jgi:hypothetical protein
MIEQQERPVGSSAISNAARAVFLPVQFPHKVKGRGERPLARARKLFRPCLRLPAHALVPALNWRGFAPTLLWRNEFIQPGVCGCS